jgi:hypothetical protein
MSMCDHSPLLQQNSERAGPIFVTDREVGREAPSRVVKKLKCGRRADHLIGDLKKPTIAKKP